jgi:hypothetical protein
MSYFKRGACAVLAIVAAASMQLATADVINSQQGFVSTTGNTRTYIVDGGNVSFFDAYDTSSVDVLGGHVGHLTLHGSTAATISDGDISWLRVLDSSKTSITGIDNLSWLVVSETSHVDILATDATFSSGHLSGTWLDGSSFEFWAVLAAPDGSITIPAQLPSNIRIHSPASVP